MRVIVLPLCFIALTAAVPAPSAGSGALPMMPGYTVPARSWQSVDEALAPQNCRDRIQQVREASGQPALDKTPATSGEGYLINAVDMRIDSGAVASPVAPGKGRSDVRSQGNHRRLATPLR